MADHGHELVDQGLQLRGDLLDRLHEVSGWITAVKQAQSRGGELEQPNMVDLAFLMKSIEDSADFVRKEAKVQRETLEKSACAVYIAHHGAEASPPEHVDGFVARGNPEMSLGANLPPKGSRDYRALLLGLGTPEKLIDEDVMRPHWPHLVDHVSRLASEGRTPPGIDPSATYPVFRLLRLRVKPGVRV